MDWYIKVLKNYAVFEGRASRQESSSEYNQDSCSSLTCHY